MKLRELTKHIVTEKLIDEIVLLVFKDHHDIVIQAMCNIVDKTPELFNPIFEEMRKEHTEIQQEDKELKEP